MAGPRPLKIIVHFAAGSAFAVLLGGLYLQILDDQFSPKQLPGDLRSAGLAIELLRSTQN